MNEMCRTRNWCLGAAAAEPSTRSSDSDSLRGSRTDSCAQWAIPRVSLNRGYCLYGDISLEAVHSCKISKRCWSWPSWAPRYGRCCTFWSRPPLPRWTMLSWVRDRVWICCHRACHARPWWSRCFTSCKPASICWGAALSYSPGSWRCWNLWSPQY